MKKYIYLTVFLSVGVVSAQDYNNKVGGNTVEPKTTLNVDAVNDIKHPAGLQAPRLTRGELTSLGNATYTAEHKGTLIYITDVLGGDALGQRRLMTEIGYYYFDGEKWQRAVSTYEYRNLYYRDSKLTGNRIVTQNAKTLDFNQTEGKAIFQNTDGNTIIPKSPIQIIDGRQGENKILASDEYGNAYWEVAAVPRVDGKLSPNGGVIIDDNGVKYFNTGASITLTEGKWALNISGEVNFKAPEGKSLVDKRLAWVTIHVGTNNYVSGATSYTDEATAGIIKSDTNLVFNSNNKGAIYGVLNTPIFAAAAFDLSNNNSKGNINGMALINVPKGGKTYYLYARTRGLGIGGSAWKTTYSIVDYLKADGQNSYFYALKLAD